jgi:hypothetical protein
MTVKEIQNRLSKLRSFAKHRVEADATSALIERRYSS